MTPRLREALRAFQNGDLESSTAFAELEISSAPTPLAHHLLGLAHCRLGKIIEGLAHLRTAADAEPGNNSFQLMFARALMDAGRPQEVLDLPEPGPIRCEATLNLWRVRGEAADALRKPSDAEAAWSKVTAAASMDWRAWSNLGDALAAQGRWNEGIAALTNSARLNGSEPSIHWRLALALAASERNEQALDALRAHEQLAGPSPESRLARARNLLALARFEEAEQAYRDALDAAPTDGAALRELGLLYERTNQLGRLSRLINEGLADGVAGEELTFLRALLSYRDGRMEDAQALLEHADPLEDQVRWNQLKARIADRLGKTSEAFQAVFAMKRAVPDFAEWDARSRNYRAGLRRLEDGLRRLASELPQLEESGRKAPAFLVGFPRSGTTLLDTFLMGHPEISVLEEIPLLSAAERVLGQVTELSDCPTATLERARDAYFEEFDNHVDPGFSGLVIDKLPLNLLGAHLIQAMFPGAPIIFMQRHPCDAVLSGFMQGFVMNDAMASFLTLEGAADLYDAVMSVWMAAVATGRLTVYSVSYERLVENPDGELRPLLEFLGLPWHAPLLDHRKTATRRGPIITPSYDQVTEVVTTRSVGRWRRYEEQFRPVLPVLLPWANKFGYRQ